jgi:TM2 domain-containing membrane protein YozV
MQWFVMKNGQQSGPYTVEQLREMLGTVQLASTDHVWREGMAGWLPISAALATTPPPMPAPLSPHMPPPFGSQAGFRHALPAKSHAIYVILALFLGSFGIHNFYAGRGGRGVGQLLVTFLSLGLLVWVVWIWNFIDVLTVSSDGDGVPFR